MIDLLKSPFKSVARGFQTPYISIFCLTLPCIFYILFDRSLWPWDCSNYGDNSIHLYLTMINHPWEWFSSLITVHPFKPPMLNWLGQFFVPIGLWMQSIDTGLMVIQIIFLLLSLLLLFKSLNEIFDNRQISIIGCLSIVAAPLSFKLFTHFWVEPLQLFAVVWFIYIFVCAKKWDTIFTLLQLIAAMSFAMLVKISSPIYCLGPGLAVAIEISKTKSLLIDWKKQNHFIMCAFAALLSSGCAIWYGVNFQRALGHVTSSSTSLDRWGKEETFIQKLIYWLHAFQESFFVIYAFYLLVPVILFSVFIHFKRKTTSTKNANALQPKPLSLSPAKEKGNLLIILSLLHIAGVLLIFSCQRVSVSRYLLPLLPYVAVIICWSLNQIKNKWMVISVCLILLSQFGAVNFRAFDITKHFPAFIGKIKVTPIRLVNDNKTIQCMDEIIRSTYDNSAGRQGITVTGFGCYSRKSNLKTMRIKYYLRKKAFPQKLNYNIKVFRKMEKERSTQGDLLDKLIKMKPLYYITVDEDLLKNHHPQSLFYQMLSENSVNLLSAVSASNKFELMPLRAYPKLRIFRFVGDGLSNRGPLFTNYTRTPVQTTAARKP